MQTAILIVEILIVIALVYLMAQNSNLIERLDTMSQEIDDLKNAVSGELQAITEGQAAQLQLLTDVDAAVTKLLAAGPVDPAIENAAQQITAATQTLRDQNAATAAAAAKIEAALNPPA